MAKILETTAKVKKRLQAAKENLNIVQTTCEENVKQGLERANERN